MSESQRARVIPVLLCVVSLIGRIAPAAAQQATTSADEHKASVFVETLLAKMTLEEKLGQMSQLSWKDEPPALRDQSVLNEQVGSFLFVTDPKEIDRLQHLAVEHTRLHIPLLFAFDVIHGFRTIFPIPLAMAASFDPQVAEQAQRMAAREASSVGIRWTFAPMFDIARDPRWGRIMEGAGEDPFLGQAMAAAQVRGFQGGSLADPASMMACVKHFAGYGAVLGGRDYSEANISDEQLHNVYLPPFHAAVDAHAGSLMSAYVDLNGVPATGNRFLLHDVLREQWSFDGMVVSDWQSVEKMTDHGFSQSPGDAAVRAVNAGVDMEMTSTTFRDTLAAAVQSGAVAQATIDGAVRAILMAKYHLGLFTAPYVPIARASDLGSAAAHTAARSAATRTAVLLRNQGGLLPLAKTLKSIALVGPLADSQPDVMGSWSLAGNVQDAVTVLDGLRLKLGSAVTIRYARGVEIERVQPSIFDDQFPEPKPVWKTPREQQTEFDRAIDAVRQSDVAVLVLGETQNMSGEQASRATLTLPGRQQQLLEAAVATGKPIVLVLLNGRPLDITWASTHATSILEAWYPGSEGGNAIADLLFGDAAPGGRLPISWPRSVGQIPINYAQNRTQDPTSVGVRYWDESSLPLYPFGFGLSYGDFTLSDLTLSANAMPATGSLTATVRVTNHGTRAGDEVVQLYTHQRFGSASRPRRELKGFERVYLGPGESRQVKIDLPARELSFWSPQTHQRSVEASDFDLWVGDDANATLHAEFKVTP
jgi:beta-glucosidase